MPVQRSIFYINKEAFNLQYLSDMVEMLDICVVEYKYVVKINYDKLVDE